MKRRECIVLLGVLLLTGCSKEEQVSVKTIETVQKPVPKPVQQPEDIDQAFMSPGFKILNFTLSSPTDNKVVFHIKYQFGMNAIHHLKTSDKYYIAIQYPEIFDGSTILSQSPLIEQQSDERIIVDADIKQSLNEAHTDIFKKSMKYNLLIFDEHKKLIHVYNDIKGHIQTQ
ncbi:hypothetical protein [Macrococcus lamae]|uniref:Lipoprotein n=1 Tax=Macrococcus lamae TaxID=198484 RepID=A0A4R6BT06_9STAP|nr:hypothetical protein [Macrococcus lamae]TDM07494.1 hypothetical protein ERX29_08650 [Macrococcus lamae]